MPIPFACPYCGARTEVSDAFAGLAGPCANCGRQITIPVLNPQEEPALALPAARAPNSALWVLVVLILCVTLVAVASVTGLRALWSMLEARMEREECAGQLKRISLALEAYHGQYNQYPPAYLADRAGKPMHSWRVLLLPYLDGEELYQQYDFDEPWDGPHNGQLADQMPPVYGCPCDPNAFDSQTSYLAVVDPATGQFAAEPPGPNAPRVKAKTSYVLVEVAESGVNWLEPKDIVVPGPGATREASARAFPFSLHPGGAHALAEDGTVELVEDQLGREAPGTVVSDPSSSGAPPSRKQADVP